jgi:hypothetical protein
VSDTNALVLSDEHRAIDASQVAVHEIALDERHIVMLTFPPDTTTARAQGTIRRMRKLLDAWWTNREPFLVVGLLDGLELRFAKKEPDPDEN